jgi:hypothetical protein
MGRQVTQEWRVSRGQDEEEGEEEEFIERK